MSPVWENDRRGSSRVAVSVPFEMRVEGHDTPMRGATSDLSLTGCYIQTSFSLPVGTRLELKLEIDGSTLLILGAVATCDPQVGNGIRFTKMLPEDIEDLRAFLQAHEDKQKDKQKER
jgi:PilZ domain